MLRCCALTGAGAPPPILRTLPWTTPLPRWFLLLAKLMAGVTVSSVSLHNEDFIKNKDIRLDPENAQIVANLPSGTLKGLGEITEMYLRGQLLENGEVAHENLFYFVPPKALALPENPEISISMTTTGIGHYELRLKAEKLAKNVFLEFEDSEGFFSDNYFDLQPGVEKVATFDENKMGEKPLTAEDLKVLSLVDTY